MENKSEKNWAMAVHLSIFAGMFVPLAGIVAPVVIWLTKRAESPFVDKQGKEVINFMLSNVLITILLVAAFFVSAGSSVTAVPGSTMVPAIPLCVLALAIPFGLYSIAMPIVAAVKCANGEDFKYPGIIRFFNRRKQSE